MSFDIFFQTGRFATTQIETKDPFNGSVQKNFPPIPLEEAELDAVKSALADNHAIGPDEFGFYVIELEDGGTAEIQAGDLQETCMVSVQSITPGLVKLLFDVLQAGKWVMLPAMEPNVAVTCSPELLEILPARFGPAILCRSQIELGILLLKGFTAWQNYRNTVLDAKGSK
jgi:hypothetical protein